MISPFLLSLLSTTYFSLLPPAPWLCPFVSRPLRLPRPSSSHVHSCAPATFTNPLSPPNFSSSHLSLPLPSTISLSLSSFFFTMPRSKNHPPPKSPRNNSSLEMHFISFDSSEFDSSFVSPLAKSHLSERRMPKNPALVLLIL